MPLEEKFFKITEKRLKELLASEAKLIALESGGVDNWGWYGDSIHDFFADYIEERGLQQEVYHDMDFDDYADIEIRDYEEV